MLEQEGSVEVRRGRGGGVFTRPVSTDGADPEVVRILRATASTIAAASEARSVTEPAVAELAASRVTPEALRGLEELNEEIRACEGDDHRFMRADTAFHLAVATACGNPLLQEVVERSRIMLARALEVLPDSPAWHERSVLQHAELIAALRAGDGRAARRAMGRHVEHTDRALRLLITTVGS